VATAEPLPAKVNLKLYRGDTRIWEDHFTRSTGEPIDLTGHTFRSQIRSAADSMAVLCTIDIEVTDAAQGVIRRVLSAAESQKLTGGSAVWDLESTSPDGFVRTYMSGRVTILSDVARSVGVFVQVPGLLSGHGEPPTDTTGIEVGTTYLDLDTGTVYQLT
jgi:hypothetical protein